MSKSFKIKEVDNLLHSLKSKYSLITKIGEGAFGKVYFAKNKTNKKEYAIKIQQSRQKEFKYELKILKKFANKCKSYFLCIEEVYIQNGTDDQALVMELLEGIELKKYLKDFKIQLLNKLITAVEELHKFNIAHKDIKPANINYDEKTKTVKLIDYGVSCIEQLCNWGGSPFYMHPKLRNNRKKYPLKTWQMNDWYSLYIIATIDLNIKEDHPDIVWLKNKFKLI